MILRYSRRRKFFGHFLKIFLIKCNKNLSMGVSIRGPHQIFGNRSVPPKPVTSQVSNRSHSEIWLNTLKFSQSIRWFTMWNGKTTKVRWAACYYEKFARRAKFYYDKFGTTIKFILQNKWHDQKDSFTRNLARRARFFLKGLTNRARFYYFKFGTRGKMLLQKSTRGNSLSKNWRDEQDSF